MYLLFKQLTRELLKHKIFIFLLGLLVIATSFMYFFVHFSIDINLNNLSKIASLSKAQEFYINALHSNVILARNFLFTLTALTSFVFLMFFYRFFTANSRQIGCLKSLGFTDNIILCYFVSFTVIFSLLGAILGMTLGFFASDILIQANEQSYSITTIMKGVNVTTIAISFIIPTLAFCLVTFLSLLSFRGKEIALLLNGSVQTVKNVRFLVFLNRFVAFFPTKEKFPLRLALRKPLALALILVSVIGFSVTFILGYSLNLSSAATFDSQTKGHYYQYDMKFDSYQMNEVDRDNNIHYLYAGGLLRTVKSGETIEQVFIGLEDNTSIFELVNSSGESLPSLEEGSVYISPALMHMYNISIGDLLTISLSGNEQQVTVADIAENATNGEMYLNKNQLATILSIPANSYNGILSLEQLPPVANTIVVSNNEKIEALQRASVSNQNSAVINQVIGAVTGIILLFLALLLNFQDNTKDIFILHLMGKRMKDIRKMLINIYYPLLCAFFLITIIPSIFFAKSIQNGLSIQTGDYMPFQTNMFIIIAIFLFLQIIYACVQFTFTFAIISVLKKNTISDYTNTQI